MAMLYIFTMVFLLSLGKTLNTEKYAHKFLSEINIIHPPKEEKSGKERVNTATFLLAPWFESCSDVSDHISFPQT